MLSTWWGILIVCVICFAIWVILSIVFYKSFFKRLYDFLISVIAIIILSPIFLSLIIFGTIEMKGNPFFVQLRPGLINKKTGKEKIFRLIKFRTMNCKKDTEGNLLPDEDRLTKYGKILRATSLDELPELFNILLGQMSIVGPRPLLIQYLPLYNEVQRRRHEVLPGLTGLAQINGRNAIAWNQKFELDVKYVDNISFFLDIKIVILTALKVLKHEGISQEGMATMGPFLGNE